MVTILLHSHYNTKNCTSFDEGPQSEFWCRSAYPLVMFLSEDPVISRAKSIFWENQLNRQEK